MTRRGCRDFQIAVPLAAENSEIRPALSQIQFLDPDVPVADVMAFALEFDSSGLVGNAVAAIDRIFHDFPGM